uniref:Uncharacterized protein n=1 Tax=Engystomops pustulosus TaxID=76066 RepID=A0AAV6YXF7_ENGPU|nr:hypothetical protein GDO81_022233 [Engystomops pustulosus]
MLILAPEGLIYKVGCIHMGMEAGGAVHAVCFLNPVLNAQWRLGDHGSCADGSSGAGPWGGGVNKSLKTKAATVLGSKSLLKQLPLLQILVPEFRDSEFLGSAAELVIEVAADEDEQEATADQDGGAQGGGATFDHCHRGNCAKEEGTKSVIGPEFP